MHSVSKLVDLWSQIAFPGEQILKWRLMNRTYIRDCYWVVIRSGRKQDWLGRRWAATSLHSCVSWSCGSSGAGWPFRRTFLSWDEGAESSYSNTDAWMQAALERSINLNRAVFFGQVSPQGGLVIKDHLLSVFSTAGRTVLHSLRGI